MLDAETEYLFAMVQYYMQSYFVSKTEASVVLGIKDLKSLSYLHHHHHHPQWKKARDLMSSGHFCTLGRF
jgi:hypothetical protein